MIVSVYCVDGWGGGPNKWLNRHLHDSPIRYVKETRRRHYCDIIYTHRYRSSRYTGCTTKS